MQRHTDPPALQLGLDLRRQEQRPPIAEGSTALMQALADLLLGALGENVEQATNVAPAAGGSNESEDHV